MYIVLMLSTPFHKLGFKQFIMDGDIIKTGLHYQQFFKVASEQQKELASKYSSSEHL